MAKLRTYLDTGVLIAAFNGDQAAHDAAFAVVDDPEREFITTDILRLELLPKAIFHKQLAEAAFYEEYFKAAVQNVPIESNSIEDAYKLACRCGLSAFDSLHVQLAMDGAAVEFVTTEGPTKPFFRISAPSLKMTSLIRAAST